MNDLISRQAAKEAVRMVFKDLQTRTEINILINDLPPAQPERKTGKWIDGNQMFECSECGTCYTQSQFYQMRVRISDTEFPKFCPDCGADMREGQDEQRK